MGDSDIRCTTSHTNTAHNLDTNCDACESMTVDRKVLDRKTSKLFVMRLAIPFGCGNTSGSDNSFLFFLPFWLPDREQTNIDSCLLLTVHWSVVWYFALDSTVHAICTHAFILRTFRLPKKPIFIKLVLVYAFQGPNIAAHLCRKSFLLRKIECIHRARSSNQLDQCSASGFILHQRLHELEKWLWWK